MITQNRGIMVKFYSYIDDHEKLKFAVICAKTEGKFVLCKHKMRDTLEFPGGHREAEEFIVDTAERELKEETGAKDFTLEPVCIYGVKEGDGDETYGMLCVADITSFEPFDSEIEKIVITDTLPDNWTYLTIQPYLLKELNRRNLI